MAGAPRRRYEFAVLVLIIGALALLLLQALERARREIEDAAVQSEIAALRIALLERAAHREVHGGTWPASDNPVDWAGRAPEPYRGMLSVAPTGHGVWYFDTTRRELVYLYRSGDTARFRLERAAPMAGSDTVPGRLAGIGLRRVDATVGER